MTEINDFLRLLYARAARAYSPVTGEEMVHYTDAQIADLIMDGYSGRKVALLAPVVAGRKGHYRELFEAFAQKRVHLCPCGRRDTGNHARHASRPLQGA